MDQAISERLGEVEQSEPKKQPTPKSTKKKAPSSPKNSSDGSAQPKSAKKRYKKTTIKELVDAERAVYEAGLAEFEMLDAKPSPLQDLDYLRWVELHPDLTQAQKRKMKAERMTLIDSRKKASTPAKTKSSVAKSSTGANVLGILKGKFTQKEIAQKIKKLEYHMKSSASSVGSGRPPTVTKRGRGRPKKVQTEGDKIFQGFV